MPIIAVMYSHAKKRTRTNICAFVHMCDVCTISINNGMENGTNFLCAAIQKKKAAAPDVVYLCTHSPHTIKINTAHISRPKNETRDVSDE